MSAVDIIAIATSFSLLSGWRLYLVLLATGLAMRFELLALPQHLAALDILANPWVLGAAGIGLVAEFLADKIAWIDSGWDAIHSFIRPAGGALIALAIVDPADPGWQIATLLLGGSAALLGHGVKAGTRTVINASPEPFSNAIVSTGEDVATLGIVALALAYPVAAGAIATLLLLGSLLMLLALRRLLKRLRSAIRKPSPPAA